MKTKKLKASSVPSSGLARASRLLGAGIAFVGRELAVRSQEAISVMPEGSKLKKRLEQVSGLVDTLSQLKGAAMKAGQLISLELSDLLPPEITEVIRTLHDSAASMPFDQVQKILRKELGPELLKDLKNISNEPISSASIGQVHSAELNGKKVAIKVQFPGVDKSIGTDLALVRKAVESILWAQNKKVRLDGFFEECERVLKQEVDYRKEAKFINRYGQLAAGSRDFLVPQVYEQYSTRRVLVLSYMEGERLSGWIKAQGSENERKIFAEKILNLLFSEFFEWGLMQTDPNFGNFLYRPDTEELVLLDFGACNAYSQKLRREIVSLLKVTMNGDQAAIIACAENIGVLDARESSGTKALFCKMMDLIVSVYRPNVQPFDFANSEYLKDIRTTTMDFANRVQYTAPAKDLIFLNRKLGGMFHLLKDLGVKYDLHEFWSKIEAW